MATIADTRRSRLRLYMDDRCEGVAAELARRSGKSPSFINDLMKGTKSFGEKVARGLEKKLDLPPLWLDFDHDDVISIAKELGSLSKEALDHVLWIVERDKADRSVS